ncbi:MAG: hypothetical protein WC428_01585 [Candidatus Paceibacterota bacterium]|jgi:hypothetical protein
METIVKFNYAKMKEDIKTKAEEQKFLKNQRKTIKIIGERVIPAKDATYKHMTNREDLRIMYAAYGLARGKNFSQIENHYLEENHPLQKYQKSIDRLLEKYKMLVKVETVE